MMGGINVHPETAESTVPGLFAAGEAAAGMHGANRLGGNSLSDLAGPWPSAGPALLRRSYAKKTTRLRRSTTGKSPKPNVNYSLPLIAAPAKAPTTVHRDLQDTMRKTLSASSATDRGS